MKRFIRRCPPRPSYRPTLEILERRDTPSTFTVNTTADTGAGSLRQAIMMANANPGLDTIAFSIPGAGIHVISVPSPLPLITDAVIADGTTQPNYAGTPLIQLDGLSAGAGANGLALATVGSTVKGLSVTNFSGYGIVLAGGGDNSIAANYLGLTPAGAAGANGTAGLLLFNGSVHNVIGESASNVISGNGVLGIFVLGAGTSANAVVGNFIGTNTAGTAAVANGLAGVDVQAGASGNVFNNNFVSGNGGFGFLLADPGTSGNTIAGDFIGLSANDTPLGAGASGNTIGGATTAGRDLISGNDAFGVFVDGAGTNGNLIANDYIGLDVAGSTAVANVKDGIALQDGAANNVVSADIVSGNGANGISITGAGTSGTVVQFCYIGLNAAGDAGRPNGSNGVEVHAGAAGATIGSNVIASNFVNISFTDVGTTGNTVVGNFIGTDATGSVGLGLSIPAGFGVMIFNASGNTVGGLSAAARNVITVNNGQGIFVAGSSLALATGNTIVGNFIGLNAAGTAAPTGKDQAYGVTLNYGANGNNVSFNVIGGNIVEGLYVGGATNVVSGNFIGVNLIGTAVANKVGVYMGGLGNTLGGTTPGLGNVISANTGDGVQLLGFAGASPSANNVIQGNYIGVKPGGAAAAGNGSHGVQITGDSVNNTIGGTAAGAGNVIANNGGDGVEIDIAYAGTDPNAGTGNAILGNAIFGNAMLGIDLGGDGVTLNGHQTTGQSPNHFVNFPVLTNAYASGSLTVIQGTYGNGVSGLDRLEFFASPSADPSGHGQGTTFLGFVTASSFNTASFFVPLETGNLAGQAISATATDASGDTSEFSADILAH